MTSIRSATVIGLGLIGGSLVRDLRSLQVEVRAWDADPRTLEEASRGGDIIRLGSDLDGAGASDLVVLAVPVQSAGDVLRQIAGTLGVHTVITDVGSTKCSIVRTARELEVGARFVGSHPLAGDHRSGWTAGRAGLFEGARVFLTPTDETPGRVLDRITSLWVSLGARPEAIDAQTHDRRMAWISHLPQAVSTALGLALHEAGIAHSQLGPGGRDVTRLAASSAQVWADILCDNAQNVVAALRATTSRLGSLTAAVEQGDHAEITRMLEDSSLWATVEERTADSGANS